MLEVQYALAFDFGRAAQSVYRAVACCPGALSAFRRDPVLPHLDGWVQQKFLGRHVNHGEDQALTNIVLRAGYDTTGEEAQNRASGARRSSYGCHLRSPVELGPHRAIISLPTIS
ncbi:MAG: hypothetical protein K0R38_424 [Polyangiaceae bacterium]|jgi:hypothetical protein|nr:hypothetical protein [Polyangiaceae bacterium]